MKSIQRTLAVVRLVAALIAPWSAAGCSSCSADRAERQEREKSMDQWVETALRAAEKTGKLDGLEIEYYVSGGLPPPHYVSEQFRLLVRDGHDVLEFATPNYDPKLPQGASYPKDIYTLPATPEDAKTIARLVLASGAFRESASDAGAPAPADALRTELEVTGGGKTAKCVYLGREPAELPKLREAVEALIERVKAHGQHEVKP